MFIMEAFFSIAALARRVFRADKVGAETAPKHAPWKGGFKWLFPRVLRDGKRTINASVSIFCQRGNLRPWKHDICS